MMGESNIEASDTLRLMANAIDEHGWNGERITVSWSEGHQYPRLFVGLPYEPAHPHDLAILREHALGHIERAGESAVAMMRATGIDYSVTVHGAYPKTITVTDLERPDFEAMVKGILGVV